MHERDVRGVPLPHAGVAQSPVAESGRRQRHADQSVLLGDLLTQSVEAVQDLFLRAGTSAVEVQQQPGRAGHVGKVSAVVPVQQRPFPVRE